MTQIKIVGGSYLLNCRKADCQRSINVFPSVVESGSGKSPAILKSIPGLVQFSESGAVIRGMRTASNGRVYIVSGNKLKEVDSFGNLADLGTLQTSSGYVGMGENLNQLIITDGENGYVSVFATNEFKRIIAPAFLGSARVAVLDGYAVFAKPNSRQFYWSSVDDATVIDELDFASAEGTSDNIVGHVVDHGQLMFFKQNNIEIWDDTGGADIPFARNPGARIETGAASAFSIAKLDNTVYWLSQDERGGGIINKLNGYTPVRVSTNAIEEILQSAGTFNLSMAVAHTYQQDGHSFYVITVPGLSTTLCFDVASGNWHERAELVNNEYAPHRGQFHTFAFGKHLIGAADGRIYRYDASVNTNAGDPLVRDRISPHDALPNYKKKNYGSLQVDCVVGAGLPDESAPKLLMRYSNDGGISYGNWREATMGRIGETRARTIYRRLGEAYDRVWHLRCVQDVNFSIVGANIE